MRTPVFVAFAATGKNTVNVGLSTSSSPNARGAPAGHSSIVFPAPPCETAETVDGSGGAVGAGVVICPNTIPLTIITNAHPKTIFLTMPPSIRNIRIPTNAMVQPPTSISLLSSTGHPFATLNTTRLRSSKTRIDTKRVPASNKWSGNCSFPF
jgi:hypothetical protein